MKDKEVIKNLNSKDSFTVLETLKYISEDGNKNVLNEVIKLLITNDDTKVRDEIIKILENLRVQDCTPVVVEAIENPDFEDVLSILVSASWKNSLDYSQFIEVFIEVFIKSEFQLAFDAFTVVDNVENIDRKLAESCLIRLENSIEDIKDDKKPLYFELINIIEDKKENPA